jgi:transcriptional regulator GlxA family with amidase domain
LLPGARSAKIVVMSSRRIVVVAFPDVQSLDVTGSAEVSSIAQRLGHAPYEIELVASSAAPVTASSGLRLVPDRAVAACRGPIDTLVVAGGLGTAAARRDERLVAWLHAAAARSRRVASVCTGAFLLAKAGLLDGRRATTHWDACAALRRHHPEIDVQPDPIFVRDGDVYTSAGVTAGIDLALALVEEDAGQDAALEVARHLVVFVRRPGGQAQFSAQLTHPPARRETLRDLQAWLPDNLDADLSVEALAERAFMSPRNFARAFRDEVGVAPAAYVAELRVERARQELEAGDAPVEAVARRCGFGTVETMRRTFRRRLHASPAEYRDRFRAPKARGA